MCQKFHFASLRCHATASLPCADVSGGNAMKTPVNSALGVDCHNEKCGNDENPRDDSRDDGDGGRDLCAPADNLADIIRQAANVHICQHTWSIHNFMLQAARKCTNSPHYAFGLFVTLYG